MLASFERLAGILREECGKRPVYYVPNSGNWGDGLIRHGTRKFFSDIDLKYKEMTTIKKDWRFPVLRGGVVIYGGSGAWCKYYNYGEYYVSRFSRRFRVIVLPSTYESNYSLPRTVFFRRDHFESMTNMPDSVFCHDMAFFIGKEFNREGMNDGVGFFFRTDVETANKIKLPYSNMDISAKGNHLSDVSGFFAAINDFSIIHTDRLHVGIAACLLNKEVHLYPNSYFKNRAVFHSSIQGYFDNVHFHEDFYPLENHRE